MKLNSIKTIGRSDFVNMGPIQLRQPIPTKNIEQIDPFILLHHAKEDGKHTIDINNNHQTVLYLLKGNVTINGEVDLIQNKNQLIEFNQDGNQFSIQAKANSKLLFLSGAPLNEKVKTYGPYVMNTQSEIMEAMRDYQTGKMGFLPAQD